MKWVREGFLNTLEHGLSRGLDAFSTLILLWFIPTEKFSQLALAQAYVAPALFFFISPETILYRDYGRWKMEGKDRTLVRLRCFRRFAWAKLGLAVVLAFGIAALFPSPVGSEFSFPERFMTLIWAFSLPLAPQFSGADREFLRLDLQLKRLNFLTVLQRVIYFSFILTAVKVFHSSFYAIGLAGVTSSILISFVARQQVEKSFAGTDVSAVKDLQFTQVIRSSLGSFSLWAHVSGTISGWVQTLDLFFLGVFGFPAREIGIYSVVLKLSNLSLALPTALSNLYQIHLGRGSHASDLVSLEKERLQLKKLSLVLGIVSFSVAFLLWFLAPYFLGYLSRGRWDENERARMVYWLGYILPAAAAYASMSLWAAWLNIRDSIRDLVVSVYIPWGFVSAVIYSISVWSGGADSGSRANVWVMIALFVLLSIATLRFNRRTRRSLPTAL